MKLNVTPAEHEIDPIEWQCSLGPEADDEHRWVEWIIARVGLPPGEFGERIGQTPLEVLIGECFQRVQREWRAGVLEEK